MKALLSLVLSAPFILLVACGSDASPVNTTDASADAARDGTIPGQPEASVDSGDTGPASDASSDAGAEAASTVDAAVDTGTDTGNGGPIDASFDAPGFLDGGQCNNLFNGGPDVPETNVAGTAPLATGGVIPLGLYYLTKWEVYVGADGGTLGPTGNTRKLAFFFEPSRYAKAVEDNGVPDQNASRLWMTQNVTLVSTQYCPTPDNLTSDYTVTGNDLALIAFGTVLTFKHQ